MLRTIPFTVFLALLVALPAGAEHCTTYSSSDPEFDTDPAGLGATDRYYVEFFLCDGSPDCMFSLWVYEESNGLPGLQRGDEETDDTCHGTIEADTIFF